MILEENDFFVINDEPHIEVLPNGMKVLKSGDFEGMIFEAMKVEGDQVLARIVERQTQPPKEGDVLLSLWIIKYEISPVSKSYAELFEASRKPDILNMFFEDDADSDDEEKKGPTTPDDFFEDDSDLDDLDLDEGGP